MQFDLLGLLVQFRLGRLQLLFQPLVDFQNFRHGLEHVHFLLGAVGLLGAELIADRFDLRRVRPHVSLYALGQFVQIRQRMLGMVDVVVAVDRAVRLPPRSHQPSAIPISNSTAAANSPSNTSEAFPAASVEVGSSGPVMQRFFHVATAPAGTVAVGQWVFWTSKRPSGNI